MKEEMWLSSFRRFWKVMIRCRAMAEVIHGGARMPTLALEELYVTDAI